MMEDQVEKIARDIETMRIRGAHRIAQSAARALICWAKETGEKDDLSNQAVLSLIPQCGIKGIIHLGAAVGGELHDEIARLLQAAGGYFDGL